MQNKGKFSLNVFNKKVVAGVIELIELKLWNKYQFIDYIYGGMTVSLFLAVDFSIGNTKYHHIDKNQKPDESSSEEDENLMNPKARRKRQKELATMTAGEILKRAQEKKNRKFMARDEDNEY